MEISLRAAGYDSSDARLGALVRVLSLAELTSIEDLQFVEGFAGTCMGTVILLLTVVAQVAR